MYIIVIDCYSCWIEIKKLKDQTSEAVIAVLKELFAQHGIPDLVISDNGPQYSKEVFRKFAATYGFYILLVALSLLSLMERLRERYVRLKHS